MRRDLAWASLHLEPGPVAPEPPRRQMARAVDLAVALPQPEPPPPPAPPPEVVKAPEPTG